MRISRGTPSERVIIRGMEDHIGRSEDIMAEVEALQTYLLGPSQVAGIIAVLAKNLCDRGGCRRFVNFKKSEGNVVAAAGRYLSMRVENVVKLF